MRNKSRNVSEHYRVSLSQTGAGIADPAAGRIDTGLLKVSASVPTNLKLSPVAAETGAFIRGAPAGIEQPAFTIERPGQGRFQRRQEPDRYRDAVKLAARRPRLCLFALPAVAGIPLSRRPRSRPDHERSRAAASPRARRTSSLKRVCLGILKRPVPWWKGLAAWLGNWGALKICSCRSDWHRRPRDARKIRCHHFYGVQRPRMPKPFELDAGFCAALCRRRESLLRQAVSPDSFAALWPPKKSMSGPHLPVPPCGLRRGRDKRGPLAKEGARISSPRGWITEEMPSVAAKRPLMATQTAPSWLR